MTQQRLSDLINTFLVVVFISLLLFLGYQQKRVARQERIIHTLALQVDSLTEQLILKEAQFENMFGK